MLWRWIRGYKPRNVGDQYKLETTREWTVSWNLQKECRTAVYLGFRQVRLISDFWVLELDERKFVLF